MARAGIGEASESMKVGMRVVSAARSGGGEFGVGDERA